MLNGKFYFGVHKTKNPNDEYLGSGTYIKRAVEKHGEQNFRKEVLFIYLDVVKNDVKLSRLPAERGNVDILSCSQPEFGKVRAV